MQEEVHTPAVQESKQAGMVLQQSIQVQEVNETQGKVLQNHVVIAFKGGVCEMDKKKYSLKIEIKFQQTAKDEQQPGTLQQLFPEKEAQLTIKVVISSRWMPEGLRQAFSTLQQLYCFLACNLSDENKVNIAKTGIRLKMEEERQVELNFAELLDIEEARKKVVINLDDIEDKLLQFSNEDWRLLQQATELYLNGCEIHVNEKNGSDQIEQGGSEQADGSKSSHVSQNVDYQILKQYALYVATMDEDELAEELGDFKQQEKTCDFVRELQKEEKEILQFEQKCQNVLKLCRYIPQRPTQSHSYKPPSVVEDRVSSAPTVQQQTSLPFPPGYTPPHIAKPTAPDGYASEDMLRVGASNSKKEKLRMAKVMLKQGYSAEEVIQRLQQLQRDKKSGQGYSAPSQGPIRPFHIPRNRNSQNNESAQRSQTGEQGNEKGVREMLIKLLREKRYKKLQDIKKHMEGEGLVTTMDILKRMIDEIRARNAQRKMQAEKA